MPSLQIIRQKFSQYNFITTYCFLKAILSLRNHKIENHWKTWPLSVGMFIPTTLILSRPV